ncbi:MAG: c-type cytochrome [Magnetovibrionaceae bacterium]
MDHTDPVKVATGRALYADHCAACHGENLEGQPNWRTRNEEGRLPAPPHDQTGHTWHHPDQQLFDITMNGIEAFAPDGYVSDMMGFKDILSDAEIWAVLSYIKSTWPPQVIEAQERRNP